MTKALHGYIVPVEMAWNDERGNFSGRLTAIALWDGALDLDVTTDKGVHCRIESDRFKVSQRWFPHSGHQTWVGNIMWDSIMVRDTDLAEMLFWLRDYRPTYFSLDGGYEEFCRWWERKIPDDNQAWLIAEFAKLCKQG